MFRGRSQQYSPHLGGAGEGQCAFVASGGGLVATGETGLYDDDGRARDDFALADLFGVTARHRHHGDRRLPEVSWEVSPTHTYLQLPGRKDEGDVRHPVLAGFGDTDQIPFGGRSECVEADGGEALATFVAPFPAYPPETSWQRHPATTIPAVITHEPERSGRVAFIPADLDRCFGRGLQPDHARLLGNAVRWAARGRLPLTYEGSGTVDVNLYRQHGRYVVHLVNLSAAGAWRMPMHEDIPIGPIDVVIDREAAAMEHPAGFAARSLVSGDEPSVGSEAGTLRVTVPRIVDHEVLVLEPR